ncbi:hypothetical protein C2S53_000648 [Perilla frutescens var. hirtella]|uniref:Uncharacterized protein n=1 Tax=Perilla frutescens var. hirtella TaxID=608512 RepID=A0AAD4P060_PERFH|nr:hypothetical protein C2S53_000648 [Perilla frutescens var. hirtella]
MLLHLSLLHILILLLPPPSSSAGLTGARPGCPDQCGNVSIPYPFGVGSDCSLHPSFTITCNNSTQPPEVYLPVINSQVNEITDVEIKVTFPNLALSPYGRTGNFTNRAYNLSQTPYMFSDDNWLTTISCDDMAAVTGQANRTFGGGCVAYCKNRNDAGGFASCPDDDNDYGLGSGCCRSPIPIGTTNLAINLSDVHNVWRESKLFSTSFAFIGEKVIANKSEFSYQLSDLDNATIFESENWVIKNTPQVLLDWRIGSENCSEARKNTTTYVCKENSDCVNFHSNVGGYLCSCSSGYEGNPYLASGCQDINECDVYNPCHSKAHCKNTPGSFSCSCRKGYSGDGMKKGDGCDRRPQSIVIIGLAGLGTGLGIILVFAICSRLCSLERTKLFRAKDLEKATDQFSRSRILGEGGQGTVYKGMLSDGKIVAIKKLKSVEEDKSEEFINEIAILSQINHINVVKLLGCCLETDAPLLVYEFVPNGTLFNLIHDPDNSPSWSMRLKIAADIAGAIAYLHSASSIPIYHRDIKSSNILLDEKLVVKVSDFGTSKVVAVDQTHLTTMVKGTFGYLDPEYFQSSQFTEKSDVYSFGVVLAELLTGQRPIAWERGGDDKNLATRLLESMEDHNLDMILDAKVFEHSRNKEVITFAKLVQRCLNPKGKIRPTMREVATELESIRISRMSSKGKYEDEEEARNYEFKPLMISDTEYTWTSNAKSEVSSPWDSRAFISEIY